MEGNAGVAVSLVMAPISDPERADVTARMPETVRAAHELSVLITGAAQTFSELCDGLTIYRSKVYFIVTW